MKQVVTAQVEIKIVVDEEEQVDVKEFREFLETAVVVNYIGHPIESADIKIEDVRLSTEMHLYSVPIEWNSTGIIKVWASSVAEAADKAYEAPLPEGECLEIFLDDEKIRKLN
jgi:hypothetical protein